MGALITANTPQCFGIIVTSYAESKRFMADLDDVINEIPLWARMPVERNTTRGIQFENGLRIIMLHNAHDAKSTSFNHLFASSMMSTEQLSPHVFRLLICNSRTIFDDA